MNILTKVAGLAFGALLPLAVAAAPAHATTYDWNFTATDPSLGGAAFTGSGTLTTGAAVTGTGADTGFEITGITGEFNGVAVTGLLADGTLFGNDNLLFPTSGTVFDTNGIGIAAGGEIEIFSFYAPGSTDITPGNNFGEEVDFAGGPSGFSGVGMFTISAVPEPASMAILGSGLAAFGLLRRRRRA